MQLFTPPLHALVLSNRVQPVSVLGRPRVQATLTKEPQLSTCPVPAPSVPDNLDFGSNREDRLIAQSELSSHGHLSQVEDRQMANHPCDLSLTKEMLMDQSQPVLR